MMEATVPFPNHPAHVPFPNHPAQMPFPNHPAHVGMPLVRIVDGELTDDELAALTAVLLARIAARRSTATPPDVLGRRRAQWQRLERRHRYSNPVSWR